VAVSPLSSATVMVIVETPLRFGVGWMVTVRALPTPPRTIFASGIKLALLLRADTVRNPARVSRSSTSKRIGPVEVLRAMTTSLIAVMVGGADCSMKLTPVTAGPAVTLRLAGERMAPPRLGVMVRAPAGT